MTHTFNGKNGTSFDRNIAEGDFLAKITLGLWDKIGCYPKSDEDCKLVARILKNRIHLNQYWCEYNKLTYNFEKENEVAIEWMKKAQQFFENCGGCIDE